MNCSVIAVGSIANGSSGGGGGIGTAYTRSTFNDSPMFKSRFMCQGVPVEYDKIDDHSINSNDSTPTVNTVKESRFIHNAHSTVNTTTAAADSSNMIISKAKDLVMRSSLFSSDLAKINQQSKA